MIFKHQVLFIISLLALSSLTQAAESIPGEFVVRLKPQGGAKAHEKAQSIYLDLSKKLNVTAVPFKIHPEFALVKSGADSKKILKLLSSDSRVEYAEPNYIYRKSGSLNQIVNDPKFSSLWGMQNSGLPDSTGQIGKANADISVVPVWNMGITGSHNIKVAVIDTGVDYTHPDLVQNILKNKNEIDGDGIDNDGNGYIDDVYGWNFNKDVANGMDDNGHGTHCAGTIGGVGNNGIGVTGVNWNVSILPVKFLGADGSGSLAAAVQSIQYATQMGVQIMSNSWGGGGYSQALYDAIAEAKDHGIVFTAAAGNESNNNDSNPSYPASYDLPNVIAVAATNNRDQIASFSNYGELSVHVAAPGVNILSTMKGGTYATYSGTSMATPHVSGIAALLMSYKPYTYQEIKDTLINTSDKVRSLSKKVVARGRVNVSNAIQGIIPTDNSPAESAWMAVPYSIETPHPYDLNQVYHYTVKAPGAKYIRVIFDSIDTERNYDTVTITDQAGDVVEVLSGSYANGYTSDYMVGDTGTISLKSDFSTVGNGFTVKKIQVIY